MPSSNDNADTASQKTTCPICGGIGFLRLDAPVGHPDFGKIVPCDCNLAHVHDKSMDNLRKISNLQAMGHYTFDRFNAVGFGMDASKSQNLQNAFNMAKQFAANPQGWLTF